MSAATDHFSATRDALDDAQLAVMRAGSALDASIVARDVACVAYYAACAEMNS